MLNVKVWTWTLATWGVISFVLCVLWGILTPQAVHMHGLLEVLLPGFRWLTVGTALLGLIESFLFGAYAGFLLAVIHNFVWMRSGNEA